MTRLQQFVRAVSAVVTADELAAVDQVLIPTERRLFRTLSTFGQRHALNVYAVLRAAGESDLCLLRAALLHDCGKRDRAGRPLALIWYVLGSQLERLPRLYAAAARVSEALRIYRDHAHLGAQLLAAAGSDECVQSLVARHQCDSADLRVQRLQWADRQQ